MLTRIHKCLCWSKRIELIQPLSENSLAIRGAYGWRKFWNIHARKTETDFSGNPLWGLHIWGSFLFSCWRAHCSLMKESSKTLSFPLGHSLSRYAPIARIWLLILSLRFLYKKETVWRAKRACTWGFNSVAAWNADTTVCISSKHWLYRSSTCVKHPSCKTLPSSQNAMYKLISEIARS